MSVRSCPCTTVGSAGPTGGAADLLAAVTVPTASLSNTNEIHWTSPFNRAEVLPRFDHHFPSHQLGVAKPDREIFECVLELLDLPADRLVFLDDNQVNVDAATVVGINAHRAVGPADARRVLEGARRRPTGVSGRS